MATVPESSPFVDLSRYVAVPRIQQLVLSPDGTLLVAAVSSLDPEGKRYATSLWTVDPDGDTPASRLTRSAKGEAGPAFLPSGDLLFTSARPDPDAKEQDDDLHLWLLPRGGGEARVVLSRKGGVGAVRTARAEHVVVVQAGVLGGSVEADEGIRTQRKDLGVTAMLHEQALVRFWDHDLGPDDQHLLVTSGPLPGEACPALRDLAASGGRGLHEVSGGLTPDGASYVTSWFLPDGQGSGRYELRVVDVSTGVHRVLATDEHHSFEEPVVSPDGTRVACARERVGTYDVAQDVRPWVLPIDGSSAGLDPCPSWDRWPAAMEWTSDGAALLVVADDHGHAPIHRIDLASGAVTRLTASGFHTSVQPSPDGRHVFALRAHVDGPPRPVRYDTATPDQVPVVLPGPPGADLAVPGHLTEVEAVADDGTALRAWLVLPEGDGPAPLMVWVHGGPLASWNGWSWRWNPWLAAARGYAVLLPDPALSTGYGLPMVARGWGQWGGSPYTDLTALVDAAVSRPDIDAERTCLLGGSYGGYMANWVAGHTDRFRCIVTHASLWVLDEFASTDMPGYWRAEWGVMSDRGERVERWSPDRHLDAIRTPMLVIHGDKDYRVPIHQALRLWDDLTRTGVEAKFLYFPNENHWILEPGNARVWYETVFAFCAEHVLGREWVRPDLL